MSKDCLDVGTSVCFWCGKASGVLINQKFVACDNKKLKQNMFMGYEPCQDCEENFAKGCWVIEAVAEPLQPDQPAMQEGAYPTGSHWVVKKEVALDIFQRDVPIIFVDKEVAEKIGLYGEKPEATIKCGDCGHEVVPDMMNNCPDCSGNMDEDITEFIKMGGKL